MLSSLHLGDGQNIGTADGRIALDCSIREIADKRFVISTTDFFFPLVDSPYLQGRIGAANVLSDLYAEGTGRCDFMLMLLASCRNMKEEEREISTREMVRGFRDACGDAGCPITGGQTVLNPWPIIGGVATTVAKEGEFVKSDGAKVGDVVVLTKALGTQVAVNVWEWKGVQNELWRRCVERGGVSEEEAGEMMHEACCSMARLNANGGMLMTKYGAHAATDVTGFGILGHAQNLSENQVEEVGIELHTLPSIKNTVKVDDKVFNFRLRAGYSAETSGGLLVCLPEDAARGYCEELERLDGCPSWIVGRVVRSEERKSRILDDVNFIEV